MPAFASSVVATRRIVVLVVLAALAALSLLLAGAHQAAGSTSASPRWNGTARVVAAKQVFAKADSPRWN